MEKKVHYEVTIYDVRTYKIDTDDEKTAKRIAKEKFRAEKEHPMSVTRVENCDNFLKKISDLAID